MPRRRAVFALLVGTTIVALAAAMLHALDADGLDAVDWAMWAAFVVTLPWSAVGFWNAAIGLVRMLARGGGVAAPVPDDGTPLRLRTAVLVCLRNEDARSVERRLSGLLEALVAGPDASRIAVFLLSDSDRPDIVAAEASAAASLAARFGAKVPVVHRVRARNDGFKAGNLRDFCERWGREFDLALVLDADSVMSAPALRGLVRTMESDPRLGIVQTLVVGLPSASPFTRTFQFGMRLGMRSYTLGSAWWQGDCGPYWGHNAIVRLAPFIAHCTLPMLPGRGPLSGWVLSHDQLEAVLMRRAGFEVRVLPTEGGSWEQNPPTLLEFLRRDLRWCQGNLQYLRLLGMPGLKVVSRVQLVLAILMFVGSPAWLAFVLLATFRDVLTDASGPAFRADVGAALLATMLAMVFAPKLASVVAALAGRRQREFGPPLRFLGGVAVETAFSLVLAPIVAVAHTVFIAGLAVGRTIGWSAQVRDGHHLPLRVAARALWIPTLAGGALATWSIVAAPGFAWLFVPFWLPLLASIPFATASASPRLGAAMARAGLAAIPDEIDPAPELRRLELPALHAGTSGAGADAPAPRA